MSPSSTATCGNTNYQCLSTWLRKLVTYSKQSVAVYMHFGWSTFTFSLTKQRWVMLKLCKYAQSRDAAMPNTSQELGMALRWMGSEIYTERTDECVCSVVCIEMLTNRTHEGGSDRGALWLGNLHVVILEPSSDPWNEDTLITCTNYLQVHGVQIRQVPL